MYEKTTQSVETAWCIQRVNKCTQELILMHALTCPASYWVFFLNLARSTKWPQIASSCGSTKLTVKSHDPLLSPSLFYTERWCELGLQRRCGASLITTGVSRGLGSRAEDMNAHSSLHMHKHRKKRNLHKKSTRDATAGLPWGHTEVTWPPVCCGEAVIRHTACGLSPAMQRLVLIVPFLSWTQTIHGRTGKAAWMGSLNAHYTTKVCERTTHTHTHTTTHTHRHTHTAWLHKSSVH